jgi:hypothetical protein
MHPLLKRIAVNGLLSAVMLGVLGLVFSELAGMWLATATAGRSVPAQAPDAGVTDSLRYRLPLTMAVWGLVFVAATEGLLYLWRGNPAGTTAKAAAIAEPDPAEKLLEELLQQAEASQAKAADAPSPSALVGENSPTPELVPGERGA